jgi:hypothetical protein
VLQQHDRDVRAEHGAPPGRGPSPAAADPPPGRGR